MARFCRALRSGRRGRGFKSRHLDKGKIVAPRETRCDGFFFLSKRRLETEFDFVKLVRTSRRLGRVPVTSIKEKSLHRGKRGVTVFFFLSKRRLETEFDFVKLVRTSRRLGRVPVTSIKEKSLHRGKRGVTVFSFYPFSLSVLFFLKTNSLLIT